jgi:Brp/Blh family beta-carotene 15,15'-monooxygenase
MLFALVLYALEILFSPAAGTQISFLILILILFGVPHGALDLYIDQHLQKTDSKQVVFLAKYIANILVYASIWYFFPIAALVVFIFITAYHFGEIDWMGKTSTILHKFIYSLLGFAWILFLLTKNIHFALDIFLTMGRSTIQKEGLIQLAAKIYPYTMLIIVAVYLMLFFFKSYFFEKNTSYYYSLLQTTLLVVFVLYMPLWISFTFYFGFWHSLLSFDKIRISFAIPNNFTAPFSIMAWFGFAYITFLTLNSKDASGIFTLLFITLSVLALPHLQVFTKLKLKER